LTARAPLAFGVLPWEYGHAGDSDPAIGGHPTRGGRDVRGQWRLLSPVLALLGLGLFGARTRATEGPVAADYVLRGGTVIDGTGVPGRKADLAIRGDRIVALGTFEAGPKARVIDATGWVVAPGFIDLHSHSDSTILGPRTRSNLNYLTQGVTTVVTGNCGMGPTDVRKYFQAIEAEGVGTNVIHLIPHGSVRQAVLGTAERKADAQALERMRKIVAREMEAGAWGMSTGLIYLPGRYADTAELIALAKEVARHGGFYASHIRDEGAGLLRSIDEALTIGREAGLPVQVSHLKATGRANWGLVGPACEKIASARRAGQAVTADQYPYIASSTSLAAMVVPHWARQGGQGDFVRIADDPVQGPRLRREIEAGLVERGGGATVRIARYPARPTRVGRDLEAIARMEGTSPLEVVLDIERHGGAQAISFGMSEDDVRHVMAQDFVATASDGSAHSPGGGDHPHPRAYGTFPRKVRYALDEKVLSLEAAIRSCSGLPAEVLGLPDRGTIRVGSFADLVVFDPGQFRDAATFDEPIRYARGVQYLFVNGVPTIAGGTFRAKLAGRALRLRQDGPADLILKVGRIWTGDPDRPWAEALASRAGQIVAVGDAADVHRYKGSSTRIIDRPGDFAMPGLIDAHAHLIELGAEADLIDLRGVASPEAVAQRVKAWIDAHPGDTWVQGRNFDQSLWPGGEFASAAVLDDVASTRPVWLVRVDGHAAWANSEAMRRAKVTRDSQPPKDGQILRDKQGDPLGVFVDGAMTLVWKVIPPPTPEEIARRILAAQARCFEAGLTGIHDASVSEAEAEAYRRLDREHKLKLRVYGMASPRPGNEVAFASRPPIPAKAGRRFEMRAIKLFIDGAMGSRGGLLFEPYADDPGNRGLLLIDPKVHEETTVAGLRHGWQICTHAIGDKGNALVLDSYAAATKAVPEAKDPRLRIEHAQVVRRSDVPRLAELGIIASMQPSHASDDMRWADARLGPGRVEGAYAWRWFLDAKVRLAFGSDFPVEVVNPFWGIYAALTRQDAKGQPPGGWHTDQRMSLDETLHAFTAGSAYAAFDEDRLGVLKTGLRTDVTVVDRDLFKATPPDVLAAKVTATVVDGEVVFEPK
jgi:predicted amidohydrolase YtcJ